MTHGGGRNLPSADFAIDASWRSPPIWRLIQTKRAISQRAMAQGVCFDQVCDSVALSLDRLQHHVDDIAVARWGLHMRFVVPHL